MAKRKVPKKELGKGIRALLESIEDEPERVVKELSHTVANISVDVVETNPYQPRNHFDEESLAELAQSIRVHGLIQPITVRRLNDRQYQLISGERRLHASKRAGLNEIPAYIRIANDQEMLEMALVENIQREDLNAMEIAITYQRLIDECQLTHEALSERIGKNRTTVTNYLRLLKLLPAVQSAVKNKQISMGHARALAGVEDPAFQLSLLQEIVSKGLSVRAVEERTSLLHEPKGKRPKASPAPTLPDDYLSIQTTLQERFGTSKVAIKLKDKDKGQIVIPFNSVDEFNRILDAME